LREERRRGVRNLAGVKCFPLRLALLLTASAASLALPASAVPADGNDVVKATLANGLRIVIVRNTLAPVVSTDMTYLVGSRDDPATVPGMAHAQEHMMFRGTKDLSTGELGTLATALGGAFNASTTETLTQFEFTVPASDLDAVLHVESDRMRDVLDAQSEWEDERGAIEQEVLHDETAPGNDFFDRARALAFAGTPYAHDGVGTRAAFDKLTGPRLKAFWQRWYAPNNAVLVVAGDVDPAVALAQIRARFESLPARPVPAHEAARLAPLERTIVARASTLVYPLALVGYRMPGVNSPDFLASFVLQGVLNAQRGSLHALADTGEALDGEWFSLPYVPEGQLGFATAALAPGADPGAMTKRLEAILADYAQHGVPQELFESTKRRLISDQEESRNSIESLASDWATTIALDDEPSIVREQELLAKVTLAEVNHVAKRYLDPHHAIVGALTPSPGASQNAAPSAPQQVDEKPLEVKPATTHLPDWAQALVDHVDATPSRLAPVQTKLPNGITLIVVPETISNSVFLFGNVRTNPSIQEPLGKEGVSSVLAGMFAYGTKNRDRVAFERAQDDIDSEVGGGSGFGLQTTSGAFERAVALLAENELEPRFDQPTFELAQRRAIEELETSLNGSNTIAMRRADRKLLPPSDPELREPTPAGIRDLTLDDVRDYYTKTIRPDLATIVVIGNVTPQQAQDAVGSAFAGWRAGAADVPSLDLPAVPLNDPGDVTITIPAMGQSDATFLQTVPLGRTAPDMYPLQLGNAILGGGSGGPEQSRLFRDLRQNAGLVYSIGSQLTTGKTRSQFSVFFACLPSNEERISAQIDAEIGKMKTEPVGAFELALVKASLVRRTVIANSSENSIGSSLLDDASNGLPLDQADLDVRQYLATDAPAIMAAFAAYIHPQNFVRVLEGP
jgi:zinc protease